jgi:hypothetical protein
VQVIVEIEKDRRNLWPVKIRRGSNRLFDLQFPNAIAREYFPDSSREILTLRLYEP